LSGCSVPLPHLPIAFGELGLASLGGWPLYSHLVPGPTFTNFTIFAAHRLHGWLAVPVGLLRVLLPSAAAMLVLGVIYGSGAASAAPVQFALRGSGSEPRRS
jgi:hypothetical protein